MVEKLSVQIALEGGAEVEKQLADIGKAGQKAFADIKNAAQQGGGFEAATKSIAALGSTGKEALEAAAAAAQKFGASANQLAGVESVIKALAARARDSGTAFSELAANYDKARTSASSFVAVNKEAGTSLATLITRVTIVGTVISAVATAITVAAKATLAFGETIQKASAEAVKLGLTLEQFNKQVQGLEKLGLSTQAATQGLQELGKAVEQVKLDAVAKAIKELEEASARGFGAQGTAQLKLLQEAANGVGPAADAARAGLEKLELVGARKIEFGMAIPPGMVLTLKDFITVMGDGDKAMQAFQAQLRGMPDSLQRTNLAIAGMGQKAGTEFVQGLRLAEGSMSPVEAKAETLRQATERLSSEWGRFGSLTFSPAVVQGVDAATAALRGLDSVLTSMNWSAVGTAASVALNPLPNLIQLLGAAIVNLGSKFSGAGQAATQAGQQGAQGLQTITAAAGSAAAQMDQLGQKGAQAGKQAAEGLQLVANPLTGMPELINTTNQALAQTGQTGTTSFGQVGTAAQTTNTTLSTFASTIAGWNWDPIAAGVRVWNDITAAIQSAIDKLLQFLGLKPSAPATGGGAPGNARGGLLGGRGSGTSDSNLAWVSRGEHIMPARAVGQPGVLAFLEALRRSGGNLSRVLDGMGRFALGGMVPRSMPAFASGGLAGGMSNVTIQFPGLPAIGGLRASSDVVDQLHRAAALAQVRSGGRKPSRYS